METDKNQEKKNVIILQDDDNVEKVDKNGDIAGVEKDLFAKTAEGERLQETLEKPETSNVSTNLFSKDHHRTSKAFGPGHEPGAL